MCESQLPEAKVRPSGDQARHSIHIAFISATRAIFQVSVFKSVTTLSRPAVARRVPSGEKSTALRALGFSARTPRSPALPRAETVILVTGSSVLPSQTFTLPSRSPATSQRPSGENATAHAFPLFTFSVVRRPCAPGRRTITLSPNVASATSPFGEMAMPMIASSASWVSINGSWAALGVQECSAIPATAINANRNGPAPLW